jgi:hypothetical protein
MQSCPASLVSNCVISKPELASSQSSLLSAGKRKMLRAISRFRLLAQGM